MIELKKVSIEDREWVEKIFRGCPHHGSEYTFSNLLNWSEVYNIRIAALDRWLLISSGDQKGTFAFPAGCGDVKIAVAAIEEYCIKEELPFVLYSVNISAKSLLEENFPGRFEFIPTRENFDYIYLSENLASLKGNKYQSKRNHIARFKDNNPDWSYESITHDNLEEVIEMNTEWGTINKIEQSHSLKLEAVAVQSGFKYYFELGLVGGLIRANGKVVAYTFGSPATEDTFVVHVEKAFTALQGAYPMINQQFVMNELSQYQYVNREDDLGDVGLRMSKESYRPEFLYERFVAAEAKI